MLGTPVRASSSPAGRAGGLRLPPALRRIWHRGCPAWSRSSTSAPRARTGFDALLATAGDGAAPATLPTPDTPAVILYTSGTTGRPKGAVLTHGSLLASAAAQRERQETGPDDVLVATLPFNHVGGLTCTVLHALVAGARLACSRRSPRAAAEAAAGTGHGARRRSHDVRAAAGRAGEDRARPVRVRIATVGGANVDPPLAHAIADGFAAARLQNLYGLSETSGGCVMSALDDDLATVSRDPRDPAGRRRGPRRRPGHGRRGARRGRRRAAGARPTVAAGYWEMRRRDRGPVPGRLARHRGHGDPAARRPPRAPRPAQGDVPQGGFNVYPVEVENVLAAHPGSRWRPASGCPDDVLGEVGLYFVVPRDPAAPPPAAT